MRLALAAALAVCVLFPCAAADDKNAQDKKGGENKKNLEETLAGYLTELGWEPSLDDYKKLGSEQIVVETLEKAVNDENLKLYARIRALHALAAFPKNAAAVKTLKEFLKPGRKAVLRRAAAYGLANALGEKAVASLETLAADEDPLAREGAAIALSRIPSKSAESLLYKMLKLEKHPIALDTIGMAIYVWKKSFSQ